ncbi:MAG: hypothetical protein H6708_14025 [Kofleriaceae bacterium]|nr:hypothetical protein [Myxococcales bacterium]MCB9561520.1 hypothetical protein [Kofleriaceae bacterium]
MAHPSLATWLDVEHELPAEDVSWFAIRQPSVIRLLEQQLWSPDGDAFAVALDAVCRVAARVTHLDGAPPPRLSRDLLIHGLAMTRVDGVDPGLSRWLRWVIDAAPVVLTAEEEGAVMECVAAMLWAIAAADLGQLDRDVGDTIVA